jgi:hypothetical protein
MTNRFIWGLMFLFFSCSQPTVAPESEEKSIRDLLEKESATWRNRDVKGHADCWQWQPYSRVLVTIPGGQVIDVPREAILEPAPESMGDGGTSVNTNYKMNINGDQAWVSHDELSVSAKGDSTFSYEFRMLEKIGGQWKMVGQSIHLFRGK